MSTPCNNCNGAGCPLCNNTGRQPNGPPIGPPREQGQYTEPSAAELAVGAKALGYDKPMVVLNAVDEWSAAQCFAWLEWANRPISATIRANCEIEAEQRTYEPARRLVRKTIILEHPTLDIWVCPHCGSGVGALGEWIWKAYRSATYDPRTRKLHVEPAHAEYKDEASRGELVYCEHCHKEHPIPRGVEIDWENPAPEYDEADPDQKAAMDELGIAQQLDGEQAEREVKEAEASGSPDPDLLNLLAEALPYIEEGEQFNKPSRRGLSKKVRAAVERAEAAHEPFVEQTFEDQRLDELARRPGFLKRALREVKAIERGPIGETPVHRDIAGMHVAFKITYHLMAESQWHAVTPLPDDVYRVHFKPDALALLTEKFGIK